MTRIFKLHGTGLFPGIISSPFESMLPMPKGMCSVAAPNDDFYGGGGPPKVPRPGSPNSITARVKPLFKDSRVESFYKESQAHGVDYDKLSPLLQDIFNFSELKLEEVRVMLEGHAHLSDDYAKDIADAIQRHLDKKPPRADRNADVILRFEEFEKQGGQAATWDTIYSALTVWERQVGHIQPYAIEGKLMVKQAMMRELKPEHVEKLWHRKLRSIMEEFLEISKVNVGGLFHDFIEDDRIPSKVRKLVLQKFNLVYDPRTAELMKDSGKPFDLDENPDQIQGILSSMIGELGHRALSDPAMQSAYCEHVINLLIHYMMRYPHFKEHIEGVENHLDRELWLEEGGAEKAKKFYEHAKELVVHGLMDYQFGDLFPTVRRLVAEQFPRETELREKLLEWGEEVPKGQLSSEWLDGRVSEYFEQAKKLRSEGNKKAANLMYMRYAYLANVDLSTIESIKKIPTWREFVRKAPDLLKNSNSRNAQRNVRQIFRYFSKLFERFNVALNSFGMFFEEVVEEGARLELQLVPVKGLTAAIAIDSGSDCGKGGATNRSMVNEYSTFLITDKDRTKIWGYIGLHEVDGDGKLVLQIDAMNPSTQLNLSGASFLNQMRRHLAVMDKESQGSGSSIAAFLVSKEPLHVSNRDSISNSSSEYLGSDALGVFGKLTPRLQNYDEEGVYDISDKIDRLEKLLVKLFAAYRKKKDRLIKAVNDWNALSTTRGIQTWGLKDFSLEPADSFGPFSGIKTDQINKVNLSPDRLIEYIDDCGDSTGWLGFSNFYRLKDEVGNIYSGGMIEVFDVLQELDENFGERALDIPESLVEEYRNLYLLVQDLWESSSVEESDLEWDIGKVWSELYAEVMNKDVEQNWQADPKESAIFYQPE